MRDPQDDYDDNEWTPPDDRLCELQEFAEPNVAASKNLE